MYSDANWYARIFCAIGKFYSNYYCTNVLFTYRAITVTNTFLCGSEFCTLNFKDLCDMVYLGSKFCTLNFKDVCDMVWYTAS